MTVRGGAVMDAGDANLEAVRPGLVPMGFDSRLCGFSMALWPRSGDATAGGEGDWFVWVTGRGAVDAMGN